MPPKLYGVLGSPAVRAVLMCAKQLGVELQFVPVSLVGLEHLKDEFLQKNPQHTVPMLEDEDGFILVDSHAIMGYLVSQYGRNDSLYPKNDNRLRATIDHRLHFDSSILFVRGLYISRPLLWQGVKPSKETLGPLKEAYQMLDKMLGKNKGLYAVGNALTIADFSFVATLTSWAALQPYDDCENVKAYVENIQKLPFYEVNLEGLEQYRKRVADAYKKLEA